MIARELGNKTINSPMTVRWKITERDVIPLPTQCCAVTHERVDLDSRGLCDISVSVSDIGQTVRNKTTKQKPETLVTSA